MKSLNLNFTQKSEIEPVRNSYNSFDLKVILDLGDGRPAIKIVNGTHFLSDEEDEVYECGIILSREDFIVLVEMMNKQADLIKKQSK